jgi:hypothetical protein
MAASTRTTPQPEDISGPSTMSLDNAVERLQEYAAGMFAELESSGDLTLLIEQLGYLRDRADQVQNVAIAYTQAIRDFL